MAFDYPPLSPPGPFRLPRSSWSPSDGRIVLAWLLSAIEPRTDDLLRRLDRSWDDRPAGWLASVEAAIPVRIWTDAFWVPSHGPETIVLRGHSIEQDAGPTLSVLGEALGVDIGLLLARSLAHELGDGVSWAVAGGARTYVSRRMPMLRGAGKVEFDPVLVGLVVARRWLPGGAARPQPPTLEQLHERWLASLSGSGRSAPR